LVVLSNLGASLMLFGAVLDSSIFIPYAAQYINADSSFWYFTLLIGALIPLTRMVISIFFLADTPAYHVKYDNTKKANQVLKRLYLETTKEESVDQATYERVINHLIKKEKDSVKTLASTKKLKKDSEINQTLIEICNSNKATETSGYKPAMVGFFVWYMNQFTGVQAVNSYSTSIFKEIVDENTASFITMGMSLMGFLSAFVSMVYIKKVPRKTLLVFGGLGCSICLFFMFYFGKTKNAAGNITVQLLYRLTYGVSVSAATWPYCNEIVKSELIYIPFMSQWIMIAIVVFVFPVMVKIFTVEYVFLAFGIITIINCLVSQLILKETKG